MGSYWNIFVGYGKQIWNMLENGWRHRKVSCGNIGKTWLEFLWEIE
jgi:hypothetical protein